MAGNFDELLKKATAEKLAKKGEPLPEEPIADEPTQAEPETADAAPETAAQPAEPETLADDEDGAEPTNKKKAKHTKAKKGGCLHGAVLFAVIICFCAAAAYFVVAGAFDFVGLNKSDAKIDVVIPDGAPTKQIATILEENNLIDQPLVFRLYSKVSHKDGTFQAGTYSLSANMGYAQLASVIIAGNPRETVKVTIPEGYTIDQIAKKLEENKVCTTADFYDALLHGTYDYAFFNTIPQSSDGGVYEGRIYRLEGYLFPDTYEFYTESAGKTVVNKFLSAFDAKFTAEMRSAMQAQGLTMDQVVTMASILEKEAAGDADMPKVARVLYNRLDSDYTRLECDSTAKYVANLMPNVDGLEIISKAYNTYQRSGLPAGPICNPSLTALSAALNPSTDAYIKQCYYFANDTAGNTYYSKTFAQHEAACRKHGIGMYG